MAKEVLRFQWVRDDITQAEHYAIWSIRYIAKNDLELAWHVLRSPFMDTPFLQRDAYALNALSLFSLSGPPQGVNVDADPEVGVAVYEGKSDMLVRLSGQSWFGDGLDDDDAALVHGIFYTDGDFREALMDDHYVASTSITLPLTGDVGLAVVRHTPFSVEDKMLETLEEGVRIMEDFMGAPLPLGDVTLLLIEPEFWTSEARAELFRFSQGGGPLNPVYVRGIIRAVNPETGPPTRTLYHELGHYYLVRGPRWLEEGLANFLEAYTVAQTGGEGLEERLAYLESRGSRCAENIWEHVNPYRGGQCDYELGEKFLLGMYAALGREAASAALRELYNRALIFETLNHDSIYYAFKSNVPLGKEEAFGAAWRRYHGSPVIDRVHADSPDRASLVALYNATNGDEWIINRNWLSDAPVGAWYGVYTNPQGQVTGLELDNNGLTGELPSELGSLSNLIELNLEENRLTGEIPPELGNLSHLDSLGLEWNQLTGEIPPQLGNLTNLTQMRLSWNQLTGGIPLEFGHLINLRAMTLHGNQLTGKIPSELGNLTKLETLWLFELRFTGCIAVQLPEIWVEATGRKRC